MPEIRHRFKEVLKTTYLMTEAAERTTWTRAVYEKSSFDNIGRQNREDEKSPHKKAKFLYPLNPNMQCLRASFQIQVETDFTQKEMSMTFYVARRHFLLQNNKKKYLSILQMRRIDRLYSQKLFMQKPSAHPGWISTHTSI